MLFNSYVFLFAFLPVTLVGYFAFNSLKQPQLQKVWLILASLFFYSFYNVKNLPLILLSIAINYSLGQLLKSDTLKISKKSLLILGIAFNVSLLCFFKYAEVLTGIHLVLPLGLSFYTLQQIAYLVDTYEGMAEEKSFIDYLAFVTFFPQLISGPIAYYKPFMTQMKSTENKSFNVNNFSLGIFIFCLGLAKKVLISDTFAGWAKPGFDELQTLDFILAWKTSLSYTFQLYYDFSGYTDMAIGLGHMFNMKLPQNFNSPFRSKSVIEFWSRWHMTLGQFINTYLFTPIVRSMPKINFRNTMIATFTAMFIAGVWHGAGVTFAVYGALHGSALVVNHIRKKKKKKLPEWAAVLCTFLFVNMSFVVFRAKTMADAFKVLKGMSGFSGFVVPKVGIKSVGALSDYGFKMGTYLHPDDYLCLILFLGAIFVTLKLSNSLDLEKKFVPTTRTAFLCGTVFVFCLFGFNRITEFIYFNF